MTTRTRTDSISLVEIEPLPLDRLKDVMDDRYGRFADRMRTAAQNLDGRALWNLNSTPKGGGVAEMISSLMPYAVDAGWNVRWAVMRAEADFFDTTKAIHNALHGVEPPDDDIWARASDVYRRATRQVAADLVPLIQPGDVVFVHDPQAAGLLGPLVEAGAKVAWQCHVGKDEPNEWVRKAWNFLRGWVERAHRYVFTREAHFWDGLERDRLRIIPPSIDALSAKNAPMSVREVREILTSAGVIGGEPSKGVRRVARTGGPRPLDPDARFVLEVSRWDRLKDPIGFLRMYADHLDRTDVDLVFAGPSRIPDDPEGGAICDAAAEFWRSLKPSIQEHVHLLEVPMEDVEENARIINALQRRADVVVQKSIEEGFGLTVSEAMWKARPVVASRVGGIQDQIEHGRSGLLVDDPYDLDAFAHAVGSVLDDGVHARRLGIQGQRRVRDNFLGPRQLCQCADLVEELIAV